MLLYVLPVVFAVGGIAFPIGVLIYWTTSNLWTMGQQFYVIRNNPAPRHAGRRGEGEARRAQGGPHGGAVADHHRGAAGARRAPGSSPARQQPKKQSREQRKKNRPQGEQK
jgi:YidC/Oxa1 family membrane protein insertase